MKFYESHTYYEWAWQVAADMVEPFGPERDDIRGAILTGNLIASNCAERPNDFEFQKMVRKLMHYLKDWDSEDDIFCAEALKAIHSGE